jgi:Uma2 family endonuclease
MTATQLKSRSWTKEEYYRLVEQGQFHDQHVQLINGEIIDMPPQGPEHFLAMNAVYEVLRREFAVGACVRMQGPLDPDLNSAPEPDIAVVPGVMADYKLHPKTAMLIVEISDSSLWLDRKKAHVYAASGVDEYWIVNLRNHSLEVFRRPVLDAGALAGFRYIETQTLVSGSISPLARPGSVIQVGELLGNASK